MLSDLCWYSRGLNQDSAQKYGRIALGYSTEIDYQKGVAQAYNDLGIIKIDKGEYDFALALFDSSMAIRELLKDTLGIAALYNKIGIIHQNRRDLTLALAAQLAALKIYEEKALANYAAYCKNNIAILYHDQNNYEKAIEFHKQLVKYRKEANLEYDLGASYLNLANVYYGWGKKKQGYFYYDSALTLLEKYPDKEGFATCISGMGSSYMQDSLYNKALVYLKKAYSIRKKQGQATYLVTTQLSLGKTYLAVGELNKAKHILDSALIAAKKLGIKEHIKQA